MIEPVKVAQITTVDMALRHFLLKQMTSLQESGYEVVGISAPGPFVSKVQDAGIRHISIPMTRRITPIADLFALWKLYRTLRKERFSIVHAHTFKAGVLGQLAARMARVKIVVRTLHGFDFHQQLNPIRRRFYITLEKVAALCSTIILSVNREDVEIALREGICPPSKIDLIGPGGIGVDLELFNPFALSPDEIDRRRIELGIPLQAQVVGFVGRLSTAKGFPDFLAAFRQIIQQIPNARALIAGDIDIGKADAIEPTAAKHYGIESECVFLGWHAKEDMPVLYSLMDVLILPSIREGFPLAIMEASAMGTPVVATDVKGSREAVAHNRSGILVPLGDVDAIATAALELLTDLQKAREMGEQGFRIAAKRFDERLVLDRIQEEYSRLLKQQGLAAPPLHSLADTAGR